MSHRRTPLPPAARGWAWPVVALLLVLQVYALYSPSPGGPPVDHGWDKAVHAALFLCPVAAAGLVGRWRVVALLSVVHAPVSELIQGHFLPTRSGDPLDAVADLVGVVSGALVAWLLVRTRARAW